MSAAAALGAGSRQLRASQSATFQGQLTMGEQWALFSVEADQPGAYVRLLGPKKLRN